MSLVVGSAFIKVQKISDGSGSKIFHPGRVSHLWFGFEFQKFPLKMSNFLIFFSSGQKNIATGRVGKYLDRNRVGLLYTAGQK